MFTVQMFKVKIPNPNCKSHVQNQNSETHASFSMSRFRNPFLLFKLKFYQFFGALAFPKRSPSQKYKKLFDALKIRSHPKPTFHVQSQVSKTHVTFKAKSRFRNPRRMFKTKMFRVKIPKPRVSCSKSRFQIPIASLMFKIQFPKPESHLQSSSPEINWSGVE